MSITTPESLNASTRYCAVFGQPVKHSASPAMHNAALQHLGLDWRYLAFEVPPRSLLEAIGGCKAMGYIGLNLTIPHKMLAVSLVDALDPSAEEWGAVNTIRFEARTLSGSWEGLGSFSPPIPDQVRAVGFNTDAYGLMRSLEEDLDLRAAPSRVLILGAGGAGRVAALKLAQAGAKEIYLVNRTEAKLGELVRLMGERYPGASPTLGYPTGAVDLVVNATSLGLRSDDPMPFDAAQWSPSKAALAYDMIYRPAETRFLKEAVRLGCRVANGLGMLLHQGAKSLEIWSGRSAPLDVMRQALIHQVYGR